MVQAPGPDDDGVLTAPERVGEWIYRELRRRILTGQLPPGSRLSVPALAREFGVSRSPVRDAVLHLVRDGLGQETLNRGAIVRTFSPENLVGLYEAMEALEGMVARLAADRSDRVVHQRLTDLVREHRAEAFHHGIWTAAASPVLSHLLEDIQGQIRLAMCSARLRDQTVHPIEDHQEVLEAIASGDADASEAAARRHVRRLRATLWEVAASPRVRGAGARGGAGPE